MGESKHVLIVDDEPNVRLVFRTALESAGYAIDAAENGQAALDTLARHPADIVLMDLRMPIMDGMEALERLRMGGNEVPVIVITAHGDVPNAVHAMKLGAIDFLQKPIGPEALRKVVAEVLDRHEAPRAIPAGQPVGEPVTAEWQFTNHVTRAKRALNKRWFDEAEVELKQAIALVPTSAEAHNLMGVLHELRNEHDDSYREYKAALKADRHYEPARHNMQRYYERFTFGRSEVPVNIGEE